MTRFYNDPYSEMERYKNWPPTQFHCYDERTSPMGFPYADGRSVRATHHVRPDRLVPDAQEQDQPNLNPTRRRIAVACSRCRKRKIKCSGDTGGGMGCQNCRTAGVGNCNFTRVGTILEVGLNQASIGISANYVSPSNSERLQMLNAQAYHYTQPPLRLMTGNLPANPYYPTDGHCEVDSRSDNYMLSPATPLTPSDPFASYPPTSDNVRAWSAYGHRYAPPITASHYGRYPTYDAHQYTAELPTRTRPSAAPVEGPNNVFSTHNLHMSLPHALPNPVAGGRELPLPSVAARGSATMHAHEASQTKALTYSKPYTYAQSSHASSSTRTGSIMSSRSSELAAPVPQKPPTISTTSSSTSPISVLPSSTGSPDVSPTTTSAPPPDQSITDSGLHQHGSLAVDHSALYGIPSASLSETRLQHAGTTSSMYTFSIARRDQQASSVTATGSDDGQIGVPSAYLPLQYPPEMSTSRTYSLGSSRHGSVDNRIHALSQRSSMPSIGHEN